MQFFISNYYILYRLVKKSIQKEDIHREIHIWMDAHFRD